MKTVPRSEVRLFDRSELVLRPNPVVDVWYALDCPPDFNPREYVSLGDYLRWRIQRFTRHIPKRCRHRWIPDHARDDLAWCRNCHDERLVRDPA